MDRQDIEALLARHKESFASRSAARLAAEHTAHGTFSSPAAGLVDGRDKIQKVYDYWLAAFPDMVMTWDTPLIDGDRVALFWRFSGTADGTFFGDAKPGTKVQFTGAAEYRVSPEGIVSARHLFDFTGALITAGVLKVKPS